MTCRTRVTADVGAAAFSPAGTSVGMFQVDYTAGTLWFTHAPSDGLSVRIAASAFPPGVLATYTDLHSITTSSAGSLETQGLASDGAGNLWWAVYDSVPSISTIYHLTSDGLTFSTLYTAGARELIIGIGYSSLDASLYAQIRHQTPLPVVDRLERIPLDGSATTTVIVDLSGGLGYVVNVGQVFFIGGDVFAQVFDSASSLYALVRWDGGSATWTSPLFGTFCLEAGIGLRNVDASSSEVEVHADLSVAALTCSDYALVAAIGYTSTHARTYLLVASPDFTMAAWWVVPAPSTGRQTNWIIGSQRRVTV